MIYQVEPLSATEVARHLGCHVNSVKRIPPKDLPYFRFGSRGDRRYRIQDVNKYIEDRLVTK